MSDSSRKRGRPAGGRRRTRKKSDSGDGLRPRLLEKIENISRHSNSLVFVEEIPPRKAIYGKLTAPLSDDLKQALASRGIKRLYTHQADALKAARKNENLVVVTGTASGKTLCYLLPVLESMEQDPGATALMLFPTKALAQDQLKGLAAMQESGGDLLRFMAGVYDGDTPPRHRSKLREEASVILTNPDMLHSGILPNHARWARFFSSLRYVVCDEIHVYRGIFGSNVANVLRRLQRICRHYGADPKFICSSATIANPGELAEGLTGQKFSLIERDGSPRGKKYFALWNPRLISETSMDRRSSNIEAKELFLSCLRDGYQGITFVRARQVAEVLLRYCQESLAKDGGGIASRVRAYRGGYLPEERREIEQALFDGELLGVISTNALELGIDVGSLDVALMVGYPGTIASAWQQAGRAGRTDKDSLAVLIAHNTPIDQYLMRHPEYFFQQTPENAVIDPNNPHILLGHLRSAAYELPVGARDEKLFGDYSPAILQILEDHHEVREIKGRWYYSRSGYPAAEISLRNASDSVYVIVDTGAVSWPNGGTEEIIQSGPVRGRMGATRVTGGQSAGVRAALEKGYRIIGTLDEAGAFSQLYPQAIYMHEAVSYFVDHLDINERVAYVHPVNLDYYTQSIADSRIRVQEREREENWRLAEMGYGSLAVSERVYLFKKIRFGSRESVGFGPIDLPVMTLETEGLWITLPAAAISEVAKHGRVPAEGLWGIANVLSDVTTIHAMCDVMDIATTVDSRGTGVPSVFLYDKYPGGLGFSLKAFDMIEALMQGACDMISDCPCEAGCPSCVGAPVLPFSSEGESGRGRVPDKEAALVLLHHLLEKEPYIPKGPKRAWEGVGWDPIRPRGDGDDPFDRKRRPVKPLPPEVERRLRRSLGALRGPQGSSTPPG
jgi:DEAD/DEAH box helicase domain-containing protein